MTLCAHHLELALSATEYGLRRLSDASLLPFVGGMAGAFI